MQSRRNKRGKDRGRREGTSGKCIKSEDNEKRKQVQTNDIKETKIRKKTQRNRRGRRQRGAAGHAQAFAS